MHVLPIGDHAGPAIVKVRCRTNCTGLATAKGAHCIEDVGEPTQSFLSREIELRIRGKRVSGRHDHAAPHELANRTRRHLLGRQRDERSAMPCRAQNVQRPLIQSLDLLGHVDSALGHVDKGPLNMTTEHSGHARLDGSICGANSLGHNLQVVTDHRGQQTRRSKSSMCRCDTTDTLEIRVIIEQDPAATVDLQVDESRYEIPLQHANRCVVRAS